MCLLEKAQKGDADALAALVRRHMPLVHTLCRRLGGEEDVFQAGCLGLLQAIRRFDAARGAAFSTYAVPVILGEMRCAMNRSGTWRSRKKLRQLRQAQAAFLQQHMREATVGELAEEAGIDRAEVALLLEAARPCVYDPEAAACVADPSAGRAMDALYLRDMLDRLPPMDRRLMDLRFRQGKSQRETAEALHMSQPSVSRRESAVLLQMRAAWED